ncbi:MAG TPA: 2,3-bisphosphoglycerate-independent phosphoglycerate mutase, partial [Candidatus Limnocylindrales bacterium]|nr:2,3-bisphosphoglycerate-independent phosphoglycerate mutase [Candidatus Limnocylindrales bacterium]
MGKRPKPIVLTVLDGWGYRAETEGNAIALARKPVYDELLRKFPNTLISTSGPAVGLPNGQMGNSEVGHMNIGAGRVVRMDITKIDVLVANKQLDEVPLFKQVMERGRQRQLHFLGLLSDGGVHSHIEHLFALLEMAKRHHVKKVFVHCFMDGRDTPPHSGKEFVQRLQRKMRELGVGEIATLVGRYYAMDRDNRWERIELAYRALVHGEAETKTNDPVSALEKSYEGGVTDEFVKSVVITKGNDAAAAPVGLIRDDDSVIFYNFRADRARQMTHALAAPEFDKFVDAKRPKNLFYVAMTQYDKNWPWLQSVIKPEKLEHILAQVFAGLNYKNLRTAETEKYAHVTYFFNGGVEKPFEGEERILVPSPKVATYDLKPEMSAAGIAESVVKAVNDSAFDVVIVNFANADMVGHSGKIPPTVRAVETVDGCLAEIYRAVRQRG